MLIFHYAATFRNSAAAGMLFADAGSSSTNLPDNRDVMERDLPPCGCLEPGTANPSTCYCSVDDLLRIIRRRYSLAVMNVIHAREAPRYHDVANALQPISSSTLSETLHALEAARLLDRHESPGERQAVTYRLTPSGVKLLTRLRGLLTDLEGKGTS
jgi:DNA-binding HxlR family transcriptional regulator